MNRSAIRTTAWFVGIIASVVGAVMAPPFTALAATGIDDAPTADVITLYTSMVTQSAAPLQIKLTWSITNEGLGDGDIDLSKPIPVSLNEMEGLRQQSKVAPLVQLGLIGGMRTHQIMAEEQGGGIDIESLSARAGRACNAAALVGVLQRSGEIITDGDLQAMTAITTATSDGSAHDTDVIIRATWDGFEGDSAACNGRAFG